ncbi:hypothetical protein D7Z54_16985 [Salibacterium salarium]|uniref:Uncharacterized protein n=1 Tax=Salibacterium salarium TaxID=284579 RepID=A0A428N132_9BACI|nr:hypothetical protein [Salibacterium salarium]RSL32123.1 hypothetical protein D7Z54_16985 [Salibacterium salarium]
MKNSKWIRTLVFIACVGLFIGVMEVAGVSIQKAVFAQVDMEERFEDFMKNNGYRESDISDYSEDYSSVDFDLKDDLYFEQSNDGKFWDDNTKLWSTISGVGKEDYIDDFVNLLDFSVQEEYDTGFDFEGMITDFIKKGDSKSETYYNEHVRISIHPAPDKEDPKSLSISVMQNYPEYGSEEEKVSRLKP